MTLAPRRRPNRGGIGWVRLVGGTKRKCLVLLLSLWIIRLIQMGVVSIGAWMEEQSLLKNAERYQLSVQRLAGEPCAINLFGLPRAFQSLVLPSLIKNVLEPNAKYQCDYFVHYYNLTFEQAGRSGDGGTLDPREIRLLEQAVRNVTTRMQSNQGVVLTHQPIVQFTMTQEKEFWTQYKEFLQKTRTEKDSEGRLLYHPWKEKTYHMTQIANIVKMWHSIQAAFGLMEFHANQEAIKYARVAMLRSDVLYMTPVDIWETGTGILDVRNQTAVIPNFANYPVNDRMIYGPSEAVRIWSMTRFETLDDHVQWILQNNPGYGMHSETFVDRLLTRIREQGYQVNQHDTMCFFRVRADETVWVNDCSQPSPFAGPKIQENLPSNLKAGVESILGRTCVGDIGQVAPESAALAVRCPPHQRTQP